MEKLPISDLFARRSVRQFTDEPVTAEQIELLLKAAMAAPTAANRKPWHYVW
jgi:nitroreductase